jgi:hypothetical protein
LPSARSGVQSVAASGAAAMIRPSRSARPAGDGTPPFAAGGDLYRSVTNRHYRAGGGAFRVYAGIAEDCAAAMRSRTACVSPERRSAIGSGSPLTMPSKNSLRSW